jgi:hypothetical protein
VTNSPYGLKDVRHVTHRPLKKAVMEIDERFVEYRPPEIRARADAVQGSSTILPRTCPCPSSEKAART